MTKICVYLKDLYKQRKILGELAINDCKAKFASSGLGMVWAFLQPLLTLLVFWVVFQAGFKTAPISNVEFIVWFAPAYLIWMFFSEGLLQVTNSLVEYNYLIKKVNFKVNIIPPIKIVSSAIVHCGFILFIIFLNFVYGYGISIYALQVIYYFGCTCMLLLGMGWLFSALNVFVKDVYNVVAVFTQIGFWATPVFWNASEMDSNILLILKLNPMYYICEGYRETFIYKIWFWEHPAETVYFWAITVVLLIVGARTFDKLNKVFIDVL